MQKIQTRSIYAVLLLLVCGIAGVLPDAAQAAPPGFSSCQLGAENSSIHLQAKCASMLVPEDHAQPNAGKIRLHVAVLSARSGKPVHDAMFFLAGGPGQAATEAFVDEAAAFSALQLTRDIVLVDQRGTGESNPLNCPPQPEGADSINEVHVVAQTRACLKQLKDNPRFYTTTEAVRDLDAVRAALGYSTVDLYGVSYGTRVALEYLREFPSRVRSVVLDGVVPPDWNIGANLSTNAQRALNSILTRCELSTACHQAYPSLQQNFIKEKWGRYPFNFFENRKG